MLSRGECIVPMDRKNPEMPSQFMDPPTLRQWRRAFHEVRDWTARNRVDVRGAGPQSVPASSLVDTRAESTAAPSIIIKRYGVDNLTRHGLGRPTLQWFRRFHKADEYFRTKCRSNRVVVMTRRRNRYEVVSQA